MPSDSTVPSAGGQASEPGLPVPPQPELPFSRSRCWPAVDPGYRPSAGSLEPQIVSVRLAGHVSAVCPLGFASPSRTRAVDVPPSCPANHMSSTAFALPIHGPASTGLSLLITTMVFGFAAATALIRSTLAADIAVTAEIVWPS